MLAILLREAGYFSPVIKAGKEVLTNDSDKTLTKAVIKLKKNILYRYLNSSLISIENNKKTLLLIKNLTISFFYLI